MVDLATLETLLAERPPALVSVMLANNETGAIQPIPEIAALVHGAGGLLHVDAVQALEKIPININELGADTLAVSGHKVGGPKGTGALILAHGLYGLQAQVRGGGQEQGRRAGTENVTGIAGFGAADGVGDILSRHAARQRALTTSPCSQMKMAWTISRPRHFCN